MTRFFIQIYRFFRKRRALLFLFMILSFSAFVYFGSQLVYEENIAKLLPSTDNTKAEGLVFSELKVRDKIFILLQTKTGETNPNLLLEASALFVDSLLSYDAPDGDVGDILYKIDEDVTQQVLNYALDNIPVLLEPEFYQTMDS
jgi:hypothetical protein